MNIMGMALAGMVALGGMAYTPPDLEPCRLDASDTAVEVCEFHDFHVTGKNVRVVADYVFGCTFEGVDGLYIDAAEVSGVKLVNCSNVEVHAWSKDRLQLERCSGVWLDIGY